MKKSKSRRSFLKKVTLSSAALTTAPYIFGNSYKQKFKLSKHYSQVNYSTNNQINLGLIGCGMQGVYDTITALQVDGVKLVAVNVFVLNVNPPIVPDVAFNTPALVTLNGALPKVP